MVATVHHEHRHIEVLMATPYRILSLDGGGIRGVIPATVLAAMERELGQPIASSFDMIAGTSTGGILALALTIPGADGRPRYSPADIVKMYVDEGPSIFHASPWEKLARLGNLNGPKYGCSGIEGVLKQYFGDARLKDALTDVLITAYEIDKLRDQKVCKAIGVTCHANPAVLKMALEHNDFDCTQMALNAAKVGNVFGKAAEGYTSCFEDLALPVALGKKMGVTAMKIFAQERLNGKAPVEKLISYSMSLPVAATVIGMPELAHIEQNVQIAKSFKPISRREMNEMNKQTLPLKASIDRFFMHHEDC